MSGQDEMRTPQKGGDGFLTGPANQKTPGTIADELSRLEFPAPAGFGALSASKAVPPAIRTDGPGATPTQKPRVQGHRARASEDVTEQLSALTLPEPEQLASAREHSRRESISDQLSAQLSAMPLPEPERIFGGQGVHADGTAAGLGSGRIKAEEWYKLKLADGEEIPEAVRRGSTVGITSPPTSPLPGTGPRGVTQTGRFDGGVIGDVREMLKGHARQAPSMGSMLEEDEEAGKAPVSQKDVASAAAPGGGAGTSATTILSSALSSAGTAVASAASAVATAVGATSVAAAVQPSDQVVTPWDVQGGVDASGKPMEIDYGMLIAKFGTKPITPELLERFERLTGRKPHRLLRRGTFFSHRDLNLILDRYEQKKPFYLYTGRGPSSNSMHMGHQIPFMFTAWLQDVFDCPLVIQITDDEKFLFKPALKLEEVHEFAYENIKDIISCGVKLEKTFIFSDLDYVGKEFYWNIVRIARAIPAAQSRAAFGFTETDNIGKWHFVAVQSAPSFSNSFPQIFGSDSSAPCLIPCAIDQDPYFRLTRDVAAKLKYPKPCLIHCKFLPALQGADTKMSASNPNSAIYMGDTPNQIKNKINRHAFSGGGDTEELHRQNGGNPDVDVAFRYLSFFEEDDEKLAKVAADYRAGTLLTGQLKALCIKAIQEEVAAFQKRKAEVTGELLQSYMDPTRKIDPTPATTRQ